MKVIGIGNYKGLGFKSIKFVSDFCLLDANCIFWNWGDTMSEFESYETHTEHGMPGTTPNYVNLLNDAFIRRKDEIDELLDLGKIIIIELSSICSISYLANRKIADFDLIDLLPLTEFTIKKSVGNNISSINHGMAKKIFDKIGKNLEYKSIINSKTTPLMYIKDTKRVVSSCAKVGKGLIMFIPNFKERSRTTTEKITFYQELLAFSEVLNEDKPKEIEKPNWFDSIMLPKEDLLLENINELNKAKLELQKKIDIQKTALEALNENKILLYGSGKKLEEVVENIFRAIGFEIEESENGRDDLIIKYGDFVSVIEIKGVKKSAAEKYAAQLEKWVSTYYENFSINPKGILIVNSFKDTPINDRNEDTFPNQMIKYSESRNHCLITTHQLLSIFYDYNENKISLVDIVTLIEETNGIFNYESRTFKKAERE